MSYPVNIAGSGWFHFVVLFVLFRLHELKSIVDEKMSRFPHMQEFEVESKPQRIQKKAPTGYFYNSDTGKFLNRDAEGWGKENRVYLF